jgi:hypothetical protein
VEGASLTRQSSRGRVQTPKALEWNKRRPRAVSSDGEEHEVIETVPAAPQGYPPDDSYSLNSKLETWRL